jgi:putative transposase
MKRTCCIFNLAAHYRAPIYKLIDTSIAVMKQAIKDYGKPEIINSDQGGQFTCEDWISYLESEGIEIDMNGNGRAIDNIFIERFWRSVKYDYVYLHPAGDGLELYQGLKEYIQYYNYELHHQGIDRKTPAECYQAA